MRATLFTFNRGSELRLSNKAAYFSTPNEDVDVFIERFKTLVSEDYKETLEYKVVNMANIKRRGTSQLEKSYKKATGIEKQMMEEILVSRGVLNLVNIKAEPKEEIDLEKLNKAVLAEVEVIPIPKPKTKVKKTPKAKKTEKTPKVPRVRIKKEKMEPTKMLITAQNKAKKRIGQHCQFLPFGEKNAILGTIKYVVTDKRVNKVYFRILDDSENGKLYCCATDNKTLILNVNP